ncbi:unnamed protein product, partial [Sphacelaria rigidula]
MNVLTPILPTTTPDNTRSQNHANPSISFSATTEYELSTGIDTLQLLGMTSKRTQPEKSNRTDVLKQSYYRVHLCRTFENHQPTSRHERATNTGTHVNTVSWQSLKHFLIEASPCRQTSAYKP